MSDTYDRVVSVLCDSLGVTTGDILPESTLQDDLDAESIDFLDIVFRLEREFNIKIPRDELFPDHIFQDNAELIENGKVKPDGIVELKKHLPFADFTKFEKNPIVKAISDLFTVDMVFKYVESKIAK